MPALEILEVLWWLKEEKNTSWWGLSRGEKAVVWLDIQEYTLVSAPPFPG